MYEIVFHSKNYEAVDAIASDYSQAQEIEAELTAQMFMAGEQDFYYSIRKMKEVK